MKSDRDWPATSPLPSAAPASRPRDRSHLTLVYCRDRDGAPPAPPAAPQRAPLVAMAALLVAVAGLAATVLTL